VTSPVPACDERGLIARLGEPLPPGTLVHRLPGDLSCEDCLGSPTGYCSQHGEFWVVPASAPAPAAEADEDAERDEERL
jgi:hypothetical protein